MPRDPLVTIIVPVYNAGNYLTVCLDSIVNQTYRNLEILLINDGSTDGSEAVCREYMNRDPRIRLFCQKNQGQSAARNAGLDRMTGEYLAFIDADDYVDLAYIEILLGQLLEHQVSLIACGHDMPDPEESVRLTAYPKRDNASRFCRRLSRDQVYDSLENWQASACFVIIGAKLYKSEIFKDLRFPAMQACEDDLIFHHIYDQVEYVCRVDLELYHYVQSHNSVMRRNGRPQMQAGGREAFIQRLEYFQRYGNPRYIQITANRLLQYTQNMCLASKKSDRETRADLRSATAEIRRITGQKPFSFKYTLYTFSPSLYRYIGRWINAVKRKVFAHR